MRNKYICLLAVGLIIILTGCWYLRTLNSRCNRLEYQIGELQKAGILQAQGSLIMCEEIRKLQMAQKTVGRL